MEESSLEDVVYFRLGKDQKMSQLTRSSKWTEKCGIKAEKSRFSLLGNFKLFVFSS